MIGIAFQGVVVTTKQVPYGPALVQKTEIVFSTTGVEYAASADLAKAKLLSDAIAAKKVDPTDTNTVVEVKILAFT